MLAQSHFQFANLRNGKEQRTKQLKHMRIFASEIVLYIAPDIAGHSKNEELLKSPTSAWFQTNQRSHLHTPNCVKCLCAWMQVGMYGLPLNSHTAKEMQRCSVFLGVILGHKPGKRKNLQTSSKYSYVLLCSIFLN